MCESFNGRFRDEFLTTEAFGSLLEAQVLAEDWCTEYTTDRPHSALNDLTAKAFRNAPGNHQPKALIEVGPEAGAPSTEVPPSFSPSC
ncbi:integrase core domain-containing protein [Mycobacterium marinum]|uniref:integrase core domain-containing protein n=1 Tax=Mycobacterium marinum TaxID=1781 RepID=UPI0019245D48|nr:transposase [Mycobacterium marinum]